MADLNHVTRGGEPLLLQLSPGVTATKVSVGSMDNNAYLLESEDGLLLIDAADDADTLLAVLDGRRLDTVVTTHRHRDHWQALRTLAGTGARLVAGTPDAAEIAGGSGVPKPDGVWDGDQVPLGSEHLTAIGVVGHTPGSITLAYVPSSGPVHLFTGDSLFPGGPGKTGSPSDFAQLMDDLEDKIFDRFDDETVVHPGHGDDTTLGEERPHLQEWRERGW